MKFGELSDSVREALGEELLTAEKIIAGVRSGFGDMIHRGYREFKHIILNQKQGEVSDYEKIMSFSKPIRKDGPTFEIEPYSLLTFKFPEDCLEILYIKVYFVNISELPIKVALANPTIQNRNNNGYFRTNFNDLDYENPPKSIYYKKGDVVYLEWDGSKITGQPSDIEVGYYRNLPAVSEAYLRKQLGLSIKDELDITDVEIPMPEEYCNVLVNYMIWYTALGSGYEETMLQTLKNEYKYSMEDLLARKNKEDQYDESTTVIKIDGVM